ncbi:hypothetical protein [Rhodococcus sp. P1Y]|uniref:hypothetical protein n=1 Tax=Rhodococcus sp. P1Y TaxID=1302308 RepID=UPI00191372FC|nr:hypothetical protein [Rhodococcus sp. P1Y]
MTGYRTHLRSDASQLTELVERDDRGELVVDIGERVPLRDLAAVHARAAAGTSMGKVVSSLTLDVIGRTAVNVGVCAYLSRVR